jgi:hypothetical protein
MKPFAFFCVVFGAMLVLFLVATGEVAEWFKKEPAAALRVVPPPDRGAAPADGNRLHFDFYDVETGLLRLTIRARLSQENLEVESKVDELHELALKDGVIEIPVHGGLELPAASRTEDGAAEPPLEKLVLEFRSAVWKRGGTGEPTRVVLDEGRGDANDGTEIRFQELVFEDDGTNRTLRSTSPVEIRNRLLELRSPSGLEGTLKGGALERLVFRPPVAAVLDTGQAAVAATASGGPPAAPQGDPSPPVPDPGPPAAAPTKLAVTAQGALEVEFPERERAANAAKAPSRTVVRFRDQVTVFAVEPSALASTLPEPGGTRFECDELRLDIVDIGGDGEARLVPERIVALREGGRVQAFFERGSDVFVVDGERLEWLRSEKGEDLLSGEAILHGRPTLAEASEKGPAAEPLFEAESAFIRPGEDRVVFRSVRGRLDLSRHEADRERPPGRRTALERRPSPKAAESRGDPRGEGGASGETSVPKLWDVEADQVELQFEPSPRGRRELAGFVARSDVPGGVVLRSRPREPGAEEVVVTSSRLGYREADRQTTLEGTEGLEGTGGLEGTETLKPRLTRGGDWIEALRIDFFPDDGTALFTGEVQAHLADAGRLGRGGDDAGGDKEPESGAPPGGLPGEGAAAKDTALGEALPSTVELLADLAEVGFSQEEEALSYLLARSDPERLVTLSSPAEPRFRMTGSELFWDHAARRAEFRGSFPEAGAAAAEAAGPPRSESRARLELEGGELLAQEIHFDEGRWRASLSDDVTVRTFARPDGQPGAAPRAAAEAPRLEITTGRAEIEFFEGFGERPGDDPTSFEELKRLKTLHAVAAAGGRILVRGESFLGRAEEVTWAASTRELRFFGESLEEIEILQEDFSGPLRAREIVFHEARNLAVLRGDVDGQFTQGLARKGGAELRDARVEAASGKDGKERTGEPREPQVWALSTAVLEVEMRAKPGKGSGLELESLRAHDRVLVKNEAQGLFLHGDELVYEETVRELRVFSPDGRQQTLVHHNTLRQAGAPEEPSPQGGGRQNIDKIDAQEIRVALHDSPEPRPASPGPGPERWLIIEFRGDTRASFALAESRLQRTIEGLGEIWTLFSEELSLLVDPSEEVSSPRVIPWAEARGKVVFQSGDWEGTADRAVYEEERSRLTLLGSEATPARFFHKKRQLARSGKILLWKEGEGIKYSQEE